MGFIGAILLLIITLLTGFGLGALLSYGLVTFIVYIEENK